MALDRIINSDLLPVGEVILDYGCADRPYAALFKKKFSRYVGADLPGNSQATVTVEPDGSLPLRESEVDCVFSGQVLEHVGDPRLYLSEAHRILKPDGSLILSTHGIWTYHPDPNDYWRWTISGLQLEIRRAGFDVMEVRSVFNLASASVQLWQDATSGHAPRWLRPLYCCALQVFIGFLEKLASDGPSPNAAVYLILARKRR